MRGSDVLVATRMDACSHPHQDGRGDAQFTGQLIDESDFRERIDDDATDACRKCSPELILRLVVAVQPNPRSRHPATQRDLELSERGDIHK